MTWTNLNICGNVPKTGLKFSPQSQTLQLIKFSPRKSCYIDPKISCPKVTIWCHDIQPTRHFTKHIGGSQLHTVGRVRLGCQLYFISESLALGPVMIEITTSRKCNPAKTTHMFHPWESTLKGPPFGVLTSGSTFQRDRRTDIHTDRQTDRHTHTHTPTYIYIYIYIDR